MEICIDFDGTCVEHKFPEVGKDVLNAVPVMKDLVKAGHKLILFTMRSDIKNPESDDYKKIEAWQSMSVSRTPYLINMQ